jgi:hypothetical protein
MNTALESAAMTGFLLGNEYLLGGLSQPSSETTAPPCATARSNTSSDDRGYTRLAPHPDTTTVLPPASSAPRAAAESQPMAPPETSVRSHSAATLPASREAAMP